MRIFVRSLSILKEIKLFILNKISCIINKKNKLFFKFCVLYNLLKKNQTKTLYGRHNNPG